MVILNFVKHYPINDYLAVNHCISRLGVIKLFQNENGRTLTHNESVSFLKENLQDLLGRVSSTPVQDPTCEKEELVSC